MKRWLGATLVAIASALLVLSQHSVEASLLVDTDTHFAISKIRERGNPWSWFAGDWPLGNHFYRPISTLTFELDNALYRDWAPGYGWTNAIIASLCVLLLFWFVRELTDRPILAAISAVVFALWHTTIRFPVNLLDLWLLIALGIGVARHGRAIGRYLSVPFVLMTLSQQVNSSTSLVTATEWIPARTATVMTVFCLLALALYARYERMGAAVGKPTPTPLDPPATRNTVVQSRGASPFLAVGAVIATALALGSYEQAVMLPACLLAVACSYRWCGFGVRWGWQAAFWAMLVGYLVLRGVLVPSEHSAYQNQQLRFGPGVFLALTDYSVPFLGYLPGMANIVDLGPMMLLTPTVSLGLLILVANATTIYQARRRWVLTLTGWGLALLAFLPMAWLQPFNHYHYWPLAMRTILLGALAWLAVDLTVIAVSPRGTATPPRPHPAPGSLPRP